MPQDGSRSFIDVVQQLKRFLPDYLEEHWFSKGHRPANEDSKFRCFAHDDSTPSMQFVKGSGRQSVICFGCGYRGDLIKVAHHFESLPIDGREFVHKTLLTLSRRYGVEIGAFEVSSEDVRRYRLRQLAFHVGELMAELGVPEKAKERGFSEETIRSWGTLSIPDAKLFYERLKKAGAYEDAFLEDLGYFKIHKGEVQSLVFGPNIITIPLRSPNGHVVSFTGRNLDWKKGAHFPKYRDIRNSEVYQKGTVLFGFDRAMKKKPSFLYVFEGYFDVILAHQIGIENAVACCGTELTPSQIALMKEAGIHHVVLCFDRDPNDAGWDAMDRFIEKTFQGIETLRVEILELPEGHHDPDDFLKEHGKEKFEALTRKTAFRWRMERKIGSGVPIDSEFTQSMVNLIVMEPSPIFRSDMEKELAEFSGRTPSEIKEAVQTILDRKNSAFIDATEALKGRVLYSLKNAHGESLLSQLRVAATEADQVEKAYLAAEVDTLEPTIELVDRISMTDGTVRPAFVFKTGIPPFDEIYDGIPREGVMIGLLGQPSSGKSSYVDWLTPRMINYNPDLAILLHTTDDAKAMVIRKLVSTVSQVKEHKIRRGTLAPEEKVRVREAATIIKQWLSEHRLEIRDASDGFEVSYAERWIKQFRDKHPEKGVIYILDNFYKTWIDAGDQARLKVEAQSNRLQLLTQQEKLTVIKTVEPRKSFSPRLTLDDIKETKKIEMNCHMIWILHNGIPRNGRSPFITKNRTWKGPQGERPMVELQVAKVKDYPKGSVFFEFDYDTYSFRGTEYMSELDLIRLAEVSGHYEEGEKGGYQGGRGGGGGSGRGEGPAAMKPRSYFNPESEDPSA